MPAKRSKETREQPEAGPGLWFTRDILTRAFALGGCAICHAVHAAERKGIHSFLHQGMMFPSVRQKFLSGGGFCLCHFWMAKEIEDETWASGGFGLAILCEDMARLADARVSDLGSLERNPRPLLKRREPQAFLPGHDCIFCQDNREKERFLAEVLEELVEEPEFREPLANNGLCVRHGQMALQLWKPSPKRDELLSKLQAHLLELGADLREFIRKRDYQYRHETPGKERDAVIRAMRFFVGPNPCGSETEKEAP